MPSPFISPPYSSSVNSVKTIGLDAAPFEITVPLTVRDGSFCETNFITTPGSIVSVTPAETVKPLLVIRYGDFALVKVLFAFSSVLFVIS